MIKPKIVKIGPDEAFKLLERNTMNRNIRDSLVDTYAAEMKAGRWHLNGETIKIADTGELLDGQHRMWAVTKSKTTHEFLVVEGVSKDAMATIDVGAKRSFGDIAQVAGQANAHTVASVVRLLAWYDDPQRPEHLRTRVYTAGEQLEYLQAHHEIEARVSESRTRRKASTLLTPAVLGATYVLMYREDPVKAAEFIALLDAGTDLHSQHPAFLLRERMTNVAINKTRLDSMERFALALKAARMYLDGRRGSTLRWMKTEGTPVVGKPAEGRALATRRRAASKSARASA